MKIGAPSRPWRGTRDTDHYGSGVFLASRDGGSRAHMGRDFIALAGDEALFPIHAVIERIGIAYEGWQLGAIHLRGIHEHAGITMKLLYVSCDHPVGTEGNMADPLGTVQDLQKKYPGITNHVHAEAWVATDPWLLMEHSAFGEVHA